MATFSLLFSVLHLISVQREESNVRYLLLADTDLSSPTHISTPALVPTLESKFSLLISCLSIDFDFENFVIHQDNNIVLSQLQRKYQYCN